MASLIALWAQASTDGLTYEPINNGTATVSAPPYLIRKECSAIFTETPRLAQMTTSELLGTKTIYRRNCPEPLVKPWITGQGGSAGVSHPQALI